MEFNPLFSEKEMVIDHLRAGWFLYLAEDRPYPAPQTAFLAQGKQRLPVSYTTFVFLHLSDLLKFNGPKDIDGKRAEEYTIY